MIFFAPSECVEKATRPLSRFSHTAFEVFFRLDFDCLRMTQTPNVLSCFRTKPTHTNTKNQKTTSFRKLLTQYKSCEVVNAKYFTKE